MHITVLGASGYVGTMFCDQIRSRGYTASAISRSDCDLYAPGQLQKKLRDLSPDILINCAGYTGKPNVDACETDKTNCLAGNAILPGLIAEACDALRIPWGHVSSGCIYTGRLDNGDGFKETDPPNFSFRQDNCSFYSGTKALGEEILNDYDNVYVWRLRVPFNQVDSPRNYLSKLMRYDTLLEAENSLSHLDEFVAASLDCFDLNTDFGIYNMTNPGSVTTSEVVALIQEANLTDKQFKFFDSDEEFMKIAAKTPRSNCVLDCSKAISAGLKFTPVKEAIRNSLQQWVPENAAVN